MTEECRFALGILFFIIHLSESQIMKLLSRNRKLYIESLEDRQMLSVTAVADFEDLFNSYNPTNSWNGDSALYGIPNTFTSGPCEFSNVCSYDDFYGYYSWGGFGYSQATDSTALGFGNQMSAFPGSGADNSETYGIGYCDTYSSVGTALTIAEDYAKNFEFSTLMVTNTTYTALSIRDGDAYAEPFNVGDHFELIITGYDANGQQVGNDIVATLADYTGGKSFVLNTWLEVDISSLKDAVSLEFSMTTTDEGLYGPNTPFYFAIDDVTLIAKDEIIVDFEDVGRSLAPESYWNGAVTSVRTEGGFASGPCEFVNYTDFNGSYWDGWAYSNTTNTVTEGYLNQYSAFTGTGADSSSTYGIAYYSVPYGSFSAPPPTLFMSDTYANDYEFASMQITNTTYAALSMLNGDWVAKKFGSGDWFLLTITGYDADGKELATSPVEFYLADFTDGNSYIVDQWTTVDLSAVKDAVSLEFVMTSSDTGQFGMNTPSYFATDNIVLKKKSETQEPVEPTSFVVTTLADQFDANPYDNGLSLREAVTLVQNGELFDTITFADNLVGQVAILSRGEIEIKSDMTIIGTGITVNAGNVSRIFNISGTTQNTIDVTIDGLTLTGGYSKTQGGAVYVKNANVSLTDIAITASTAVYGGAIYVHNGSLTTNGGSFSGNAGTYGGGIYVANGMLVMSETVVNENTATWGGGIYQNKGTVELTDVTLSKNTAAWGGGIYQVTGNATLVDTIFSGNTAGCNGSGIAKTAKNRLTVIKNSEIVSNIALLQYIDENLL